MQGSTDNFILANFLEEDRLHTHTSPFCYNPTCLCHESAPLIEQVAWAVQEGLLAPEEATNVIAGKALCAGEEATR